MTPFSFLKAINKKIIKHAEAIEYPYTIFGIFGVISHPFFYLVLTYFEPSGYQGLWLRTIAVILCIPLIVHRKWPSALKEYLPLYWYTVILYCLPYLFTILTLRNAFSDISVMNALTVVVLIVLLIDLIPLLIILPLGIFLGFYTYTHFMGSIVFSYSINPYVSLISYATILVAGVLFAHHRKKAHEKKLRIEAQLSSKAKSDFIASMSHDIRTPLAGMIGICEKISKDRKQKNITNDIQLVIEAGNQLLNLLNQIIEIMHVESGVSPIRKVAFDLAETIGNIIQLIRPSLVEKNIDIEFHYSESTPRIICSDPLRIHRIILNLVSNAVKFTNKGSICIGIASNKVSDQMMLLDITVADTGIGIPKNNLENIFYSFEKVSPSYYSVHKGMGLGLTIVKIFVDDLDGQIHVKSELNIGTTVTCHIPVDISENAPQKIVNTKSTIAHKPLHSSIRTQTDSPLKSKFFKLLLVEDDKIIQIATRAKYEELNCMFDIASTGEEALSKLKDIDYDIIFMDIGLPGIDGFETTQYIRELERQKHRHKVPIIAITAHIDAQSKHNCIQSGMDAVYIKPLNDNDVDEIIKRFILNTGYTETR